MFFYLLFTLEGNCSPSKKRDRLLKNTVFLAQDSFQVKKIQPHYFLHKKWLRQTIAPSFLLASSFFVWGERENLRAVRNRYVPDFSNHLDDYLQYAPALGVAGLNLGGKKGLNSWKRQALNWGGSMLIMGAFVNSIKYTSKVMRPDGTTQNSFPSGHTATAFMNATFLHKEYGHINPWYSIAGYASSSYVGVSRSLNNRHWISDILAGAALGILSTELSYSIIDGIYKNKGDYFSKLDMNQEIDKPSYFSTRLSYSVDLSGKTISSMGIESALEGAYYFNKRWGIVGDIVFGNYPFPNQEWTRGDLDLSGTRLTNISQETESAGFLYLTGGPQYTKRLGSLFLLQAKLIAGIMLGINGHVNLHGIITEKKTLAYENVLLPFIEYHVRPNMVGGGGISLTAMMTSEIGLSLFSDYKYSKPTFIVSPSSKTFGNQLDYIHEKASATLSSLSIGVRFSVFVN